MNECDSAQLSNLTHVAPYREVNARSRGLRFRSTSVIPPPTKGPSTPEFLRGYSGSHLLVVSMVSSKWLSALTLLSTLGSSHAASILTPTGRSSNTTQRRDSTSYVQAAYFTNWYRLSAACGNGLTSPLVPRGIYASNFRTCHGCCCFKPCHDLPVAEPTDIDPSQLTHIMYAFADVSADTGEVFLTDSWADEQVRLSCPIVVVFS